MLVLKSGVQLNDKARDRSEAANVLLGSCGTSRVLQDSSETTIILVSQKGLQSRDWCLADCSKSSKISVLLMSAIKPNDSVVNLLIFCVWLKT